MSRTTISWADYSFNPWIGCTKVSPGPADCPASRQETRGENMSHRCDACTAWQELNRPLGYCPVLDMTVNAGNRCKYFDPITPAAEPLKAAPPAGAPLPPERPQDSAAGLTTKAP